MTHVPFWDSPSSDTVHSPARFTSSACRRDISGSQGTEMSASSRRPSVTAPVVLGQREDVLTARVVAVDEERRADPLGGSARLELLVRRLSEGDGRLHRPSLPQPSQREEKMFSSEMKMLTIETKMPVASQIASRSVPCLRR